MPDAIIAYELTRTFGDFTAVDRVSFRVGTGEVFGFLGPNGAGKTTTIKMLTGLLRPTGGAAAVAGVDVARDPAGVRRRIGYMSQKFSLYLDLTVGENVELFAGLYGVTGERLAARRAWVLAMAGLEGRERRLTAELPLGWKQRLALGCAVLHEPPVLFLDEPTSGVDPVARRAFWDLIDDLARGGTTVLVSTHYMEEAEHCDRVILMNRGRRIAEGSPAGLRAAMTEPIYEVTVEDAPAAVAALDGAPGVAEAALFGRKVHVVAAPEAPRGGRERERGGEGGPRRGDVAGGARPSSGTDGSGAAWTSSGTDDPGGARSSSGADGSGGERPPGDLQGGVPGSVQGGTAAVRAALDAAGLRATAIEPIAPSLEDVFVALVRREGGAVEG